MAGHDESQSRHLAIARNKAWKNRLFLILSELKNTLTKGLR